MNIKVDLHCHTIASTHAYSTVSELVAEAKNKGLEAIAITDHGISMPDAPHIWHFENLHIIPKDIDGVKVFCGVELNIINLQGDIDMPDSVLKKLDIGIASIHTPAFNDDKPDNKDYTSAYLGALNNPFVDILGHSGYHDYPYNHDIVLSRAKELHKLIEINNSTFVVRKNSISNCKKIALKCKELGVGIVVNSDAHYKTSVGEFSNAIEMLTEIDFPEELIINTSLDKLKNYLKPRKQLNL